MFARRLAAGLSMLAMLCGVNPAVAAKISVSFTMVHDRIRPDPQSGISVTNRFEVNMAQSGNISEDRTRRAGKYGDAESKQAKLGGNQWQVVGENQLRRTLYAPQSTTTMTITTSGSSCKLDVQFVLKPGFNEFKYKRVDTGTFGFYSPSKLTGTTCTIRD
jgi:hypothetical protein